MSNSLSYNPLVTIIFIYEGRDNQATYHIFKSVINQIYKNMEIIVAVPTGIDVSGFKNEIENDTKISQTDLRIYFNQYSQGMQLIDEAIQDASGDIIFLKTSSPTIWYPRHTISHVLQYKQQKKNTEINVCFSLIEFKDLARPLGDPFSTLGYRLQKKINVNDVIVDELSFRRSALEKSSIVFANLNPSDTKSGLMFLEQLKTLRYGFTDEISMSVYVPVQTAATAVQLQQPQANTIDQVDTDENDDIIIVKKFATVLGNVELEKSHNESLRKEIESYVAINPNLIKNIAVKRTMGMGDVALVQPFLKYIIEKYPQAKLTFYTSKERSCQDIAKLFPEYINNKFVIDDVENNQLTTDFLGQKIEYDLKYDLDLSYESRKDLTLNYAHSYFKVAGYDIPENLHMELAPISLSDDRISPAVKQFIQNNEGNYISCNLKASGWGGKELEANMVDKILNQLKEQNLKLAAVSEFASHNTYNRLLSKFDYSNAAENFYDMMALIQYSSGYVGADSGPMHVAAAYNKKLLLWQGAVLVKNTTLIDLENVIPIIKEELKCLGCKHNFFFNEIKTSNNTSTISFVPPCIARYNYICMNDYEENYLKDQTNKFVSLIKN